MLMDEPYFSGTESHARQFDQVPLPVAVVDSRTHTIQYINSSFCEMLGREKRDTVGMHWDTISVPEDSLDGKDSLEPFFAGTVNNAMHEKRYYKPDGTVVWAALTFFRHASAQNSAFHIVIANDITNLKKKEALLQSRTIDLHRAREAIFSSMAMLSEFRDRETGEHILRTRLYVKLLLEKFPDRLPFSHRAITLISSSAILHDIGKVGIPDTILLKPGKLTSDEFEVMKTHTTLGATAITRTQKMMYNDSFLAFAKEIAEYHHERWDGSGYPYGLSGSEIPLTARVMAIADVYDALRSDRPYKNAISHEDAVAIIMEESGSHFDPALTEVFYDNSDEIERIASTERERLEQEIGETPIHLYD